MESFAAARAERDRGHRAAPSKTRLALALLLSSAACGNLASLPEVGGLLAEAAAAPEAEAPERPRETFQTAYHLYEKGRGSEAEPLFIRLADAYPELGDYVLLYLARIAEERGDEASAIPRWQLLADRHPDSIWRPEAAVAMAKSRVGAQDWGAAARWLPLARQASDGKRRATALWLSAVVERHVGSEPSARAYVRELRSRFPASLEAALARDAAWEDRDRVALGSFPALRDEVGLLLEERQAARALELVRLGEARYSDHPDVAELWLLEAQAMAATGDADGSRARLEELHRRFRRHPTAARALYRLAASAWNRDQDETALRHYKRYIAEYPHGDQAADAFYAIGRIHQEARRYVEAAADYERLARLHPHHALADEARWRIGWCAYRAGKRSRAAAAFGALGARRGSEQAAALYWKARVGGDARGARPYEDVLDRHPESYYALLAERRLGRSEGAALSGRFAPVSAQGASCGVPSPHRRRFEELSLLSLQPLARGELSAYEREAPGCESYFLATWSVIGGYRQAVADAIRSGGCNVDSRWIEYCYPLAYWQAIGRESASRSLDPFLVVALIRQESLFDAQVRSSADARGLMQIIPATGHRLASELGRGFDPESLYEAQTNLELGTTYLRKLLDRYDGNLPRAVAAYNAGEAAVDKWMQRFADLDDDEFVESITYRETRNYVKRVLANRRIYRMLYAGSAPGASPPVARE